MADGRAVHQDLESRLRRLQAPVRHGALECLQVLWEFPGGTPPRSNILLVVKG